MQEKMEKRDLMFITLWSLWTERNLIREEGRRRPAQAIGRAIRIYAEETKKQKPSGTVREAQSLQGEQSARRWTKPPRGVLKLNCDASFAPGEGSGGWGFLIRDSDGDVVSAGWGRVNHLLNAFQAEVIACMHGVQTAINLGIGRLILETDALLIKQAWDSNREDLSVVGLLIEELKSLSSLNFTSCDCFHIPRDCNKAAHALAAFGVGSTEGSEHFECEVPESVNVIVVGDLSTPVQ